MIGPHHPDTATRNQDQDQPLPMPLKRYAFASSLTVDDEASTVYASVSTIGTDIHADGAPPTVLNSNGSTAASAPARVDSR
eukprot:5272003-Amphidinium_carterae.1